VPSAGSISLWIAAAKQGDESAIEALWDRYFPELVRLAREKLRGLPSRMADEEDVALSAMNSFCRAAQQGRFPDLTDRQGLWRLLFQITARKAVDLARHERRQVRGGGRVQYESAMAAGPADSEGPAIDRAGDDLSPEFAAMMAEECQRLFDRLAPDLRELALARMEGYSNEEIAQRLGCSVRTVERRLHLVRTMWQS
jgi:RNA polymerase sigma factor (sigma-70 family)